MQERHKLAKRAQEELEIRRDKLALIRQYLSQKPVVTRSDLRCINAYLGGTMSDVRFLRGRDHATDTAV